MSQTISIRGARVHNLKNVSLDLPKGKFIVMTGLSGSGKSSLAFDTIYAEGQRRYMESLSAYARQFLELQDRPDVDEITGLSPTIAIDQRGVTVNPRSTVGTTTEIYDYLRVLYARVGKPHCPKCGSPVARQSVAEIAQDLMTSNAAGEIVVLAPLVRDARGEHRSLLTETEKAGYTEVRLDGEILSAAEAADRRIDKAKKHSVDAVIARLPKKSGTTLPGFQKIVEKALELGNGFLYLNDRLYSEAFACRKCGISLPPIEPRLFSFNSPHGACRTCTGLGVTNTLDPELTLPNPRLTLAEGAIRPLTRIAGNQANFFELLRAVGAAHHFTLDEPVGGLTKPAREVLLFGSGAEEYLASGVRVQFEGVIPWLMKKYKETDSEYVRKEIENAMRTEICPECDGRRLIKEALAVTIKDKSISSVVALPLDELLVFLESLQGNGKAGLVGDEAQIARQLLKEATARLKNLLKVGVDYITLDRSFATLSGGESQRVRLATQLGSQLSGVIYILDEPSIGLHQRDTDKLIASLKILRNSENTVIVVEHDAATILAADHVVDIGPGAGEHGGEVVAQGTPAEIKKNPKSLTGLYLAGKKEIPTPKSLRKGNGKALTIKGAAEFNLKNVDVKIPLGMFVAVTGVSGSGKSTLILDILGKALAHKLYGAKELPGKHGNIKGMEHIDKVITIDQSPIGRTPRSNPATYTGVFTAIRDLFTEIPEAKMRGFDAGKFSFNVKGGGRCEACAGEGYVQIAMQFLPDVYVECKECRGKRYNAEALEIHHKGKTIADVLAMTVSEARRFFEEEPGIADKLGVLNEVGLGYLHLGQPATTLSGGEAQRVKLATELSRRATGRTLYILDEPTIGLHFEDVKNLLVVLQELVNKGNSVVTIEHDMDVIKCADWVIDLGPDGGIRGGTLVAEGPPREVAKIKSSVTGQYLKEVL